MGLLKAIGDFLFGKSPDIFDKSGNITHKLNKRTWDAWNNRIRMNPNYNWRNHRGTSGGAKPNESTPNSSKGERPSKEIN